MTFATLTGRACFEIPICGGGDDLRAFAVNCTL